MTNHWIDIKNADSILIMGSNAAEHHPISFKWVLKAKDAGATVMHVDPKFSRTSARSDFHVPLRSGTDIAFLGGMIKYILDNEKYFKEYVVEYTNAAIIVGKEFGFKDGIFTGYDEKARTYDKSKWGFEMDGNGVPKRDKTLKNPRCVFQLLKKHYSRYDLETVSTTTGVSVEDLEKVYKTYSATGRGDKAGTVMYALGWTQHTVGVQNIRSAGIIQLLLGNIGVAGGGINALRGEPNVQGSTDHTLLYHIIPGYMAMPHNGWQTYDQYVKGNTPVSKDPMSANWWQHKPKYFASLLKAWYGDHATKENGFCYELLPKIEKGEDYSYLYLFDRMYRGEIRGGIIIGLNPMNSVPNSNKLRKAMDNLEWLVTSELHHSETTDNWHRPGVDPKKVKTEVFLLPSAHRLEKEGSVTNSGRWLLWHYKAVEPAFEAKPFGYMFCGFMSRLKELYAKEGGKLPEAVTWLDYPEKYDPDDLCQRINGRFTKDTEFKGKKYKKGQQVPTFTALKDDGSTMRPELAVRRVLHRRGRQQGQAPLHLADRHAEKHRPVSQVGLVLGRSTAASCTTAPPWISTASRTTRPRPSSSGRTASGWATCPMAAGRPWPPARDATRSSCTSTVSARYSAPAVRTDRSPSTTSRWRRLLPATSSPASSTARSTSSWRARWTSWPSPPTRTTRWC